MQKARQSRQVNREVLKQAISDYNALLDEEKLKQSSLDELESRLDEAKLIFGGRKLCPYLRPHFVLESDWKRVSEIGNLIWNSLQKVKEAAITSEEILDELGMTEIERDLISIDPGYVQVSPTARLDSFLTDDSYSYVELNGESPAGIAYSDSARDIFFELPVMRKFMEKYELIGLEGRTKLHDTLLSCYDEYRGGSSDERPTVGIVDLKGLPTQQEFELCKDFFEAKGTPSIICSPDELSHRDGGLYCGDTKIDLVYRRLLVNEYLPIIDEHPALANAYRAGDVCVANSFRAKLIHKKASFAVLTDEKYAGLFDKEELQAIRDHIPWTRMVSETVTDHYGEEIDLLEWTLANKDRLALKPNDDYGGHGIFIGWVSSDDEWKDAVGIALENGDYLVQERVKTAKETFPYIDAEGNVHMTESLVDLDPMLFNGEVGSAFTRLSTTELANVTSGGGMVPTIILRDSD
ncbi:MAG: hypothetical protein DWQ47_05185 [Acidobacteria bacterium]|nr:MAG: hypothetical protein DWQ32_08735 [Acidobacteriota bacterium]REK01776.1 MAG: hypothetical protein DWQ38_05170 [Acidobacteriota bacterium]REK14732.1 MAG: hypothetical protein DWQ43_14425 [Acidobacteriota bacterium]REK45447.1 MAG: hypothetical protein DWQ47_05185 [Acidobacteriota bacterium]